jgi:hypothetical protein
MRCPNSRATPALIGLCLAAAFPAAQAAARVHAVHAAREPMITDEPRLEERLMRRQADEGPTTVFFGEDKTCGFLSGSAGAALTCDSGSTCNFIPDLLPTATSKIGVQMCCDRDECNGFLACLHSSVAIDTKACDDLCQENTFTLKW